MSKSREQQIAENVIARFEKKKREAIKWLFELEKGQDGSPYSDDALNEVLMSLYTVLSVGLEMLGLHGSRQELAEWRKEYVSKNLRCWEYLPDLDVAYSPLLDRLDAYRDAVRLLTVPKAGVVEQGEIDRLESLLKDTGGLVYRRNPDPGNEAGVQKVMHDYLSVVFPDFVPTPQIPGSLKHFQPDGGIRSIKTAIEFKYADSLDELKTALSGIYEDMAGYSGSRDWVRFYSVIYLTKPFTTFAQIVADLNRPDAPNWTPIAVVGAGKRQPRRGRQTENRKKAARRGR